VHPAHLPQLLVERGGPAGGWHVLGRVVHGAVTVVQQLQRRRNTTMAVDKSHV
jgi:hypothetical protein